MNTLDTLDTLDMNMDKFLSIYSDFGSVYSCSSSTAKITKKITEKMNLFRKYVKDILLENSLNEKLLPLLLAFIAHVRDISYGKGQRVLSYSMLYVLYDFFPTESVCLFHRFLDTYGSWRDVKGLCRFLGDELGMYYHPLIDVALDCLAWGLVGLRSPLAAKWIPKDEWIYSRICMRVPCLRSLVKQIRSLPLPMHMPMSNTNSEKPRSDCSLPFGFYVKYLIHHSNKGTLSKRKLKWIRYQWESMILSHFDSGAFFTSVDLNSDSSGSSGYSGILPLLEVSNDMTDAMMFDAIGLVCALTDLYGSISNRRIMCLTHVPFWVNGDGLTFDELAFQLWAVCSSRTVCYWKAGSCLLQECLDAAATAATATAAIPRMILVCRESPPSDFCPVWLVWSLSGFISKPAYSSFCISGVQSGLLGSIELFSRVGSQEEFVETHLRSPRYSLIH